MIAASDYAAVRYDYTGTNRQCKHRSAQQNVVMLSCTRFALHVGETIDLGSEVFHRERSISPLIEKCDAPVSRNGNTACDVL